MRARTIVSFCLAAIVGGCSSDRPTSPEHETSAQFAARVKADAVRSDWRLLAFAGQDSAAVIQDTRITLALDEDGTLRGSAGCNTYFANWEISAGPTVRITGLAATEMACGADDGSPVDGVMGQETRYLQALAATSTMGMVDADMILGAESGDRSLHFVPVDSSRVDGETDGEDPAVDGGHVTDPDSTIVEPGDSTITVPDADLVGPSWRLRFVETVEASGDKVDRFVEAVPADVTITAHFGEDGRMSGQAGCNQYFTSYATAREGMLELGPVGLTKMYCQMPPLMLWESRFVDLLGEIQRHQVVGERLILLHDGGSLHFEAVAPDLAEPENHQWPQAAIQLSLTDHGDHLELSRPGELIEVALPAQPSTGFRWHVAAPDSTALLLVGERFDPADDDEVGAGGTQRLLFEAQAPGRTTLRLVYVRAWESIPAAEPFEVGFTILGGIVPPPAPPVSIRLGSSFGECLGYCWQEMMLDAEAITLVSRGWDADAYPEKIHQESMDPEFWDRLQDLADLNDLARMDDVYGCPDCADGGAEWLTMSLPGRKETVKMEYGARLEPLAELLKILRRARDELAARAD